MDIHPWWVSFTMNAGVTTVAFDHPGTGESAIPIDEHADEVIHGIADFGRRLGDGRVAHFGASFGGNFAAMSGLSNSSGARSLTMRRMRFLADAPNAPVCSTTKGWKSAFSVNANGSYSSSCPIPSAWHTQE